MVTDWSPHSPVRKFDASHTTQLGPSDFSEVCSPDRIGLREMNRTLGIRTTHRATFDQLIHRSLIIDTKRKRVRVSARHETITNELVKEESGVGRDSKADFP